jgi:hypothetical protein
MAVGQEYLGQQVRCPHCQQVVLAPLSAPAEVAPAREEPDHQPFAFSPSKEADSIFSAPEAHDALFGDPKPPTIEMPAEPGPPAALSPRENPSTPVPERTPGPALGSPTIASTIIDPPADDPADRTEILEPPRGWAAQPETEPSARPAAEGPRPAARTGPRRPSDRPSSASTILIFLVPYSIFMTVVALYFYYQSRQVKHPLEYLPDYPAENPGTSRKEGGKISSIFQQQKVDVPLPAKLRVALRRSIQVGALEVTPEKVEKTKVLFCVANRKPEASARQSLVLTLRLRNLSADQFFCPTDPAFDARWQPGQAKPYTFLEVGSQQFFGGPIPWELHANKGDGKPTRQEYLKGQEGDDLPLGPAEQRTTILATDPDNTKVWAVLRDYRGPLLWRVRLRRGLVTVKDREMSASAVIGVEFSTSDIH